MLKKKYYMPRVVIVHADMQSGLLRGSLSNPNKLLFIEAGDGTPGNTTQIGVSNSDSPDIPDNVDYGKSNNVWSNWDE